MKRRVLLVALALSSCTIITDFSPERALERSEERCSDRVDNDGNGLVDCADPSCKVFDFCNETGEARCADGIDNDADGASDCKDVDCCSQPRCASEPACGERTTAACTDARDNDLNGLTDCADFACELSACCRRLQPILTEPFESGATACAPVDCSTETELCCSKPLSACNPLDPARWQSFGVPAPRLVGGELTPNQPCPACAVSGIISALDAELAPGLVLEAQVDLHGDTVGSLSVGLVQEVVLPSAGGAACGGVHGAFPLLAGFAIEAGQVAAVVGGAARATTPAGPGRHRLELEVTGSGSLRYRVDGELLHEAMSAVVAPYPRVRALVQGHTVLAAVDDLLLARRSGCASWGRWLPGPRGPGPVLAPAGGEGRFDASSITGPAVIWTDGGLRLFYAGATATLPGQSRLGVAHSSDGLSWTLPKDALVIVGEDAPSLSSPTVISRAPAVPGMLLAYLARAGDGSSRIALAESADGLAWKRVGTALEPGAAGRWDEEVGAPALVSYRHQLHLYYTGRGASSPLPALGLALAPAGSTSFVRLPDPVLLPTSGAHDERGVTDPTLLAGDGVLHLLYVGLSWGGRTQLNLCASEDGRNWVRYPQNPVIPYQAPGLYGGEIRAPSLVDRWGVIHLWYGAESPGSPAAIGYLLNPVVSP